VRASNERIPPAKRARDSLSMAKEPKPLTPKKRPSVWDRRRPKITPTLAGDEDKIGQKNAPDVQRITLATSGRRVSIDANPAAPRIVLERSALDCLARLVEALDQGGGVEEALADAVSILEAAALN